MPHKPEHWTETDIRWTMQLQGSGPLARCMGWSFYEHPTLGDEGHVLAVSLDFIGPNGPVVYDTGDYDVPEFL